MEDDNGALEAQPADPPPWSTPRWYMVLWLLVTGWLTLLFVAFGRGWRFPSYVAVLWVVAGLLLLRPRVGLYCGVVVLLPPAGLYGYQLVRRISFIITNGSMEPADGMGSPMAFLLGWIMESIVLLPTVIAFLACLILLRSMHGRTRTKPSGLSHTSR